MAKIRDYAVTVYAAVTASMVCEMPTHATGDLLVAFVNKDTASLFTTPGGWTAWQTQVSAGAGGGVYAKRAASAAETVTFALASETCCAVVIAVQNVNGTTEADALSISAKSGADDSTLPLAGVGVTPSHNDCLILHGLSTDSGIAPIADPPWINLFGGDTGQNSLCVAYSQQVAAAAIAAPNHWSATSDDSRGFIAAIRDDGTGDQIDAYLPLSTAPGARVSSLQGTNATDAGTYRAAASIVITTVAGKTVTGVAVATTADSGVNPFRASLRNAGVSSTTALNHVELPLTAAFDATAKQGILFGTYLNLAPRDYVDTGNAAQGGVYFLAGSTTANWRAWVIGAQFSKTEKADARNNYLIEIGASDTQYASAGTANYASLQELAFGSSGYYGAPSVLWNELWLLDVVTLAGGGDVTPFGFDDLIFVLNNGVGMLPLAQQAGAGVTLWAPIKFGGTAEIHVDCDLNTFQYPRKADEVDYLDFHVSNNKIGIEFHGVAGDTIAFTNCVFTSPSRFYWRFNASHSASSSIDFSGSTVVNALVTLRSTVTLAGVSFITCDVTQNAAVLDACRFTGSPVTASNPANITDTAFVSAGTGHALILTTAGTYTLDALTFTGYGAGGTTDAAIYNNSGGAVTLNVINGGDTPTIRNGAGASTTVNNTVTVAVTAVDSTLTAVASARVFVEANGAPLPTDASVTMARSGATVTVAHVAHGLVTGRKIAVRGAVQDDYNGLKTITVTGVDAYTFTVAGTPATPATGTITATAVVMTGLTDGAGLFQVTDFPFTSTQPVRGWVRKGSGPPYLQPGVVVGSIGAAGFSTTVGLNADQ